MDRGLIPVARPPRFKIDQPVLVISDLTMGVVTGVRRTGLSAHAAMTVYRVRVGGSERICMENAIIPRIGREADDARPCDSEGVGA